MNWVFWALILIFVCAIWFSLMNLWKTIGSIIRDKYDKASYIIYQDKYSVVVTVKEGDTLTSIGKQYGVPAAEIYDLNKDIIGYNPDIIQPGQKLRIRMPLISHKDLVGGGLEENYE